MPLPVLVAYSTRTGSTADVAEAVAEVLRQAQLQVELARMQELKTFGQYRAAIVGAPLYMGGMPSEFHKFLARNRMSLAALPVWIFVLGPIETKPEQFNTAGDQATKQLARSPWLRPVEVKIVGGRFDVNRMPFPFSIARWLPAFPLKNIPVSDIRDWGDIRAWAAGVGRLIQPAA
ncbi:MAG TPA: flavodoxin domain-containing protein [Terracidiphilus sp.]|nr:flavodoxin domain-containing protein [Terracidiphilus sp.]